MAPTGLLKQGGGRGMIGLLNPQGHLGSPPEAGDSCQFVFTCGQCKYACVQPGYLLVLKQRLC